MEGSVSRNGPARRPSSKQRIRPALDAGSADMWLPVSCQRWFIAHLARVMSLQASPTAFWWFMTLSGRHVSDRDGTGNCCDLKFNIFALCRRVARAAPRRNQHHAFPKRVGPVPGCQVMLVLRGSYYMKGVASEVI